MRCKDEVFTSLRPLRNSDKVAGDTRARTDRSFALTSNFSSVMRKASRIPTRWPYLGFISKMQQKWNIPKIHGNSAILLKITESTNVAGGVEGQGLELDSNLFY
jgi:hypothetical protein